MLAKKAFHHLKTIKKVRHAGWRGRHVRHGSCGRLVLGAAIGIAPIPLPGHSSTNPLSVCLLQEIKKSKEFEVRKILRRIKQAKEGGAKGEDLAVRTVCLQWALKPFAAPDCIQQAHGLQT